MKNIIQVLFFGILSIAYACTTLYKPNAIYSPLLKEKGELNASASMGVSGCGLFNLQTAYAISNNASLMIDGMYHKLNKNDFSDPELDMFFGEAGVGYFNKFGAKKNILFQCYSGGGYGDARNRSDSTNQTSSEVSAKYYNIFVQPGFAFIRENFEIAFDLRANYIQMFNVNAFLSDRYDILNLYATYHSDTTLYFINFEPTMTIKVGSEKLKGVFQIGLTVPGINPESYFSVNSSSKLIIPLYKASFGISYNFNKK